MCIFFAGFKFQIKSDVYVSKTQVVIQGSHFSGLTKFHDISRFFVKFPGIFSLKCKFQAVLNINVQSY